MYICIPNFFKQKRLTKKEASAVKKWLCSSRIDVKNIGGSSNNIEVKAENCKISKPGWLNNSQGGGCVVEGNTLIQKIEIKAIQDGILHFEFRGIDKKFENKRVPLWIDYKSIKIDGIEILSVSIAAWHDKPFKYDMPVENRQEITVEIEQQYHQYIEDELKDTILKLTSNSVKDNLDKIIEELKKEIPTTSREEFDILPKIQADAFISIGDACKPAFWLRKCNLRFYSLPFDWMMNYSLDIVIETLKDGIDTWFKGYDEDISRMGRTRYVKDKKNGMVCMHAFPKEMSVEDYMTQFKNIFNRRFERFIYILNNAQSICFVCNRRLSYNDVYSFLKKMHMLYPKLHICLYNVQDSLDKKYSYYKFSNDLDWYDIRDNDKNENGATRETNPKTFWIGNERLWTAICSEFVLTHRLKMEKQNEKQ